MAPRPSFAYYHPALEQPWYTRAIDLESAQKKFERCWVLRISHGVLEHLPNETSYFDGHSRQCSNVKDNLCVHDLGGHMWAYDSRPERVEFKCDKLLRPMACILCRDHSWEPR